MTMFAEASASLVDALADLKAVDGWPTSPINPPVALVVPPQNGSWSSASKQHGMFSISFDVVLIAAKSSDTLRGLQGMVEQVLSVAVNGNYGVSGVDAPGLININGVNYLGTVVHLNKIQRI